MQSKKTILIMAGGTGGHVFPALAIAQELQRRGVAVRWLGTRQGLEARVVPAAGIPISYIRFAGLRGKGVLRWLAAPLLLGFALAQSLWLLARHRPAAALGMGGFASAPGGLAAWLLRVPLLIHEQNAVAGLANRLLARLARYPMQAFPGALAGAVTMGNPLRPPILALAQQPPRQPHTPLRILVVGGSLGAQFFNRVMPQAAQLLDFPVQIRHQAGPQEAEVTRQNYQAATSPQAQAEIVPFIEDMAAAYAWADVAVCRAGAMTIGELAAAGLPALLIPYPHAVDDHQTRNAAYLVEAGAARWLPQANLDAATLAAELRQLQADPARLAAMSAAARGRAWMDALEQVTQACLQAAGIR